MKLRWFEKRTQKKRSHLGNLARVALADGKIDESERGLLRELGQRIGLDSQEIDSILNRPEKIKFIVPSTPKLRLRQLIQCVMMMQIDGEISPTELHLCRSFASKMGFDPDLTIPLIGKLLTENNGDESKIDLDQILAEVTALTESVTAVRNLLSPPRRRFDFVREHAGAILFGIVLATVFLWAPVSKKVEKWQIRTELKQIATLEKEADRALLERRWSDARIQYSEIDQSYSVLSPSKSNEELADSIKIRMANVHLKRAVSTLGELQSKSDQSGDEENKLTLEVEREIRFAILQDPRIRYQNLSDLCQEFQVSPPGDTEARFLAMRLKVAPEIYLKDRESLLRNGLIEVEVDESNRISIEIDYNQAGRDVSNELSMTTHRTIEALEKDTVDDATRILSETIKFVESTGNLNLLEEVRVSCFHGVNSGNPLERLKLELESLEALQSGKQDQEFRSKAETTTGPWDAIGRPARPVSSGFEIPESKPLLIYQTLTQFSDEGLKQQTTVAANEFPNLRVSSSSRPGF